MTKSTNPNLLYDIHDKPRFGKTMLFALQQLLAIISATIAVPMIVGNGLSPTAALFGAGAATLVYLLITKFRSPMFFGSSFAFIGSMLTAFAGAACATLGYLGIIIGTCMVALINIIVGIIVKTCGINWIYKILPPAVIGPVVAIIGLSLAGTAIGGIWTSKDSLATNQWVCLGIALITLFATMNISIFGKGLRKLVPFAIGIGIGYALSAICTGVAFLVESTAGTDMSWLKVIDFSVFNQDWASIYSWIPDFTFLKVIKGFDEVKANWNWAYLGTIALAFIPVAVCTMAEHIADHENLSTIIGHNLLEDPGLHRTMIGDGAADAVGAILGGASTTSYGESLATTALTRNASTITIFVAALMAMGISFVGPFATFLSTIPSCVLNAVCILLYGFIATSGLKMLKGIDFDDSRNIFTISVILICGVGGLVLNFVLPNGTTLSITTIACSLILGILTYAFCGTGRRKEKLEEVNTEEKDTKTFEEKWYALDDSGERFVEVSSMDSDYEIEVEDPEETTAPETKANSTEESLAKYKVDDLKKLCSLLDIHYVNKTVTIPALAAALDDKEALNKMTNKELLAIAKVLGCTIKSGANKTVILTNIAVALW